MTPHDLTVIGTAFFVAALAGVIVTLAAVALGRRFKLVVNPRLFGKSEQAISYLGGPALAAVALGAYLGFGRVSHPLNIVLGAGVVVLILGFVDDLLSARDGIPPGIRLAVEFGVATVAWYLGVSAYTQAPTWVDFVVTVVFLVGGMNAFNLLDNMDGVAGITATAVAFGMTALAIAGGQMEYALFAACIGGACTAFLGFNLVRPKAYLGDAGALFLGLTLSGMALTIDVGFASPGNFIAAVVIFAVPFTDTATRQLSRWVAGGSPFDITGSTDHLSHRLVALGFSPREAAYLHGIAGLFAGAAAGIAALAGSLVPSLVTLGAFAVFGLSFVWMSYRDRRATPVPRGAAGRKDPA